MLYVLNQFTRIAREYTLTGFADFDRYAVPHCGFECDIAVLFVSFVVQHFERLDVFDQNHVFLFGERHTCVSHAGTLDKRSLAGPLVRSQSSTVAAVYSAGVLVMLPVQFPCSPGGGMG